MFKKIIRLMLILIITIGSFCLIQLQVSKATEKETGVVNVAVHDTKPRPRSNITPDRIFMPTIGISLEVRNAKVNGNSWELWDDAASYLSTSGKLGDIGNAVIYAHNMAYLFGPIRNLKIGDRIILSSGDETFYYYVYEKKVISPEQIDIVQKTSDQRITLFTCTNFFDADRYVVVAKPATTFGDLLKVS
jgi:LPXTG-site transpeptidase (sortase) family protein